MQIPFHKAYITKKDIAAVVSAIKSGWLTMGPRTVEFEEKFKKYIGSKHAISVNSCTAALHLALEAIGLKESDEVLVPAMTFTSTAEVVCYFKAKPVLVDIDKETHNIDTRKIEGLITKKTRAIIPVHYGGQPCDMDEIRRLAKKYKIFIIEDAAHCLPTLYKNKKIGTIGDITCFSFYATKTLSTGEGGMITTNNKKWADRIRLMRLHGISKDAWKRYGKGGNWYYEVMQPGFKYNTTDINSALGLAQLNKLSYMWKKRKTIAAFYNNALKDIPDIIRPTIKDDRESSWHLYVIKLNLPMLKINRNRFVDELAQQNINVSVHFIPLYRHPFYRNKFAYKKDMFPNSEWVYARILSLPIYPSMSKKEMTYVMTAVREITNKAHK